jgi:hypothetical protein
LRQNWPQRHRGHRAEEKEIKKAALYPGGLSVPSSLFLFSSAATVRILRRSEGCATICAARRDSWMTPIETPDQENRRLKLAEPAEKKINTKPHPVIARFVY